MVHLSTFLDWNQVGAIGAFMGATPSVVDPIARLIARRQMDHNPAPPPTNEDQHDTIGRLEEMSKTEAIRTSQCLGFSTHPHRPNPPCTADGCMFDATENCTDCSTILCLKHVVVGSSLYWNEDKLARRCKPCDIKYWEERERRRNQECCIVS